MNSKGYSAERSGPERRFFAGMASRKEQLDKLTWAIQHCTKCPLWESRTHAVPGDGPLSAQAMLVGEGPAAEEDKEGHAFVGPAGRYLNHVLAEHDLERGDFFITNLTKCRAPEDRGPNKGEIQTCTSNYLHNQIDLIEPEVILLLGGTAADFLLDDFQSISKARGQVIEQGGQRYMVSYHPAARFYRKDLGEKLKEDVARLKEEL